ncbi:MAG: GntR family transcriptional regulator [Actinobacteria bacterium]|nr:GntR family transcriptional regulator [Actinomycetota bacterium]
MVIGRGPSLTEQVTAHLKARITDGAFEEGRIPSETELASDLGVSRTTVRDALSRLEHEGAIYRRQGSGTFVNPQGLQIRSRLEEIWGYEQLLRDHGYTPAVRVLSLRTESASAPDAEALEVAAGTPLLVMDKLFLEDDDPVVLTSNRFPRAVVGHDADEADAARPIYEFLERQAGRKLAYYLSDLVPVALQADRADLLGVAAGTPALSFEEVGYDAEARPLVLAASYFRDDLLRFRLMRRRTPA